MQLANKNAVCNKCNGEITARVHYCSWSRKDTNKIWHINCDNPGLTGFDPVLLQRPSTFFSDYNFDCKICLLGVMKGDLAAMRENQPCHADCKNPRGLQATTTNIEPSDPFKPIEPIEPYCFPPVKPIEPLKRCARCNAINVEIGKDGYCSACIILMQPKPALNATNDGLLNIIVDSVAKELSTKVADAINSVKDTTKVITDRLERELSDKLKDIVIPSIIISRPELPSIKIDNVHKQFKECLEYLNAGENVYAYGGPGGGKTHLGPQLAEALEAPEYFCVSLSEQSPEYKITGFTSPVTCQFVESPFTRLYENGGFYHFSELDLANDNFRASLNSALENGVFSTDRGMIKRHSKFYVFADGNTAGKGAHPAFPSRIAFDAAFAARFQFVEFEYDWQLTRHLIKQINEDCLCLIDWAKAASPWAIAQGIQVVISPREVLKIAKLRKLTSLKPEKLFDSAMKGLDIISKEKLLQNFPLPTF